MFSQRSKMKERRLMPREITSYLHSPIFVSSIRIESPTLLHHFNSGCADKEAYALSKVTPRFHFRNPILIHALRVTFLSLLRLLVLLYYISRKVGDLEFNECCRGLDRSVLTFEFPVSRKPSSRTTISWQMIPSLLKLPEDFHLWR